MKGTVFIDSDLLFRYFAINPAKKLSYETTGTSGDASIDNIIRMMKSFAQEQQMVCLSELFIPARLCRSMHNAGRTDQLTHAYIFAGEYKTRPRPPCNKTLSKSREGA